MSEENKIVSETKKAPRAIKDIYVDKVVVNIGVGEGGLELEKAMKILELVTKKKVVKTHCKVKLPTWGIRPGLDIGCKTTLRGQDAIDFINLTLNAKRHKLPKKSFTKEGNFSYGVHEYLDIPGIKYNPEYGIRGFDVSVNLRRSGYSVKLRKYSKSKIGKNQLIKKDEAIDFARKQFKVVVE